MKIVALSDTHFSALPKRRLEGDILIHAGDFYDSCDQSDIDLVQLNRWFADQDFKEKIYVPGNHDYPVFRSWSRNETKLTEAKLLVDRSLAFEGYRIYGSPWVPNCGMAFEIDEEDIFEKWEAIPNDTDILITHMPPRYILDSVPHIGNLGCPDLQARVFQFRPKVHVFGHVHACFGCARLECITFANASQLGPHGPRAPVVLDM
ncbi:metallophosphatase domain-containing protein [Pelagicoccus sp. SDUM812003]|uniref:metallophosphoesterase family protein n=1 Tax=Pelagicoccus sp. SDUM812003 TaxID=3041267 RepID=UPI00280EB964|nr:metallophosphatase domain-containing protein [Pelagicoccus sp. SDUM812003]MDQ8203354.1 metallophosphatase domain-containing protein [Pelagicoccus sp. SDUM812003]